jgi:hypothetical protein
MARVIHPHAMKYALCQGDPSYARRLFHGTRLLRCGMISPHPAIILAHGSRAAKAGPLHYSYVLHCALLLPLPMSPVQR